VFWPTRRFAAACLQPRGGIAEGWIVAWLLVTVVMAAIGLITTARIVRVHKLSRPTVTDPERVREELLAFVSRHGGRVVDLRPFWEQRHLSDADRWTVQGPLHESGQLLPADEDVSFIGRMRAYLLAPLPEQVVLATEHRRQLPPFDAMSALRGAASPAAVAPLPHAVAEARCAPRETPPARPSQRRDSP
jgi:hypothetical protein